MTAGLIKVSSSPDSQVWAHPYYAASTKNKLSKGRASFATKCVRGRLSDFGTPRDGQMVSRAGEAHSSRLHVTSTLFCVILRCPVGTIRHEDLSPYCTPKSFALGAANSLELRLPYFWTGRCEAGP